jgi:two-component system, chemotaxis family, sensor kinase CheA
MSQQEEKLRQRIVAVFRGEAQERIAALSSGLDGLAGETKEAQAALIETMFREAHSLKAAARAVDELEIELICQAVETVFAGLRRGELALSDRLRDGLTACVDALADLAAAIGAERSEARKARAVGVSSALQAAIRGEAPMPPSLAPTPAEAGAAIEVRHASQPEEHAARPSQGAGETVRLSEHRLNALLLLAEGILSDKLTVAQLAGNLKDEVAWFAEWKRERPDASEAMAQLERRLEATRGAVAAEAHELGMKVDRLLYAMKQILTLPCGSILQQFPRAVRELARDEGKEVAFTISGAELEIDRRILQELKDPLLHLVRNCIDHGIESPAERTAAGKPVRASIQLRIATLDGDKVEFEVADDGAGIATEKLAAAAVRHGILSPERAASASAAELVPLIFQSGVSTSPIITDLSGRGLGLAIVRETVERLGGSVAVESSAGRGTAFRLILRRTLAIYRGIAVRLGDRLMIVPTFSAERVLRVEPGTVYRVEQHAMIDVEGGAVPLVSLGEVLGLPAGAMRETERRWLVVVLVAAGTKRVAFEVDEVEGDQEILIKPLGKCLARVRNVQGAAILASGRVAPVLNAQDLIKSAARARPAAFRQAAPEIATAATRKSILIAEDSITARGLLRNILELAGYRIKTAVDGMEAWSMLKLEPFDLLVSDVEMPRMNGFELTTRIRADRALAELPVVLVTALESREHIERGVDVGANAYILKGGFDQSRLLDAVRRLA